MEYTESEYPGEEMGGQATIAPDGQAFINADTGPQLMLE